MFRNLIIALMVVTAVPAYAQAPPTSGDRQFDKMSTLLGEWVGKEEEKKLRVWYRFIAGGTVLVSTIKVADEPEMISMYHQDMGDMMMTHYGKQNNQPRLRAKKWKGKKSKKSVHFVFQDITNYTDKKGGHMQEMKYLFTGPKTFTVLLKWRTEEKDYDIKYKFTRPPGWSDKK